MQTQLRMAVIIFAASLPGDLSKAAAEQLNYLHRGVTPVPRHIF